MKQLFRPLLFVAAALLACAPHRAQDAPAADDDKFLIDDAGIVPYWLGLGPIPINAVYAQGPAIDQDFINREVGVAPGPGDMVSISGRKYGWRLCTIKNNSPIVDGPQAGFGNAENVATYFVAYPVVAQDTPMRLYWSSRDSGKAFVNGRMVGRFVGKRKCVPDLEVSPLVVLRKGMNIIMIKVLATGNDFGVAARLVDANDVPLKGVAFSTVPPGRQADERQTWKHVVSGLEPLTSPLSTYLVAGQIGYLPGEQKLAIASSRGEHAWKTIELHDAASDQVVYTIPKDGGSIAPMGYYATANQYISRVFFDAFKTPGRYFLYDPATKLKSFPFDINEDVYKRSAYVLTRMYYYQRSGIDWDEHAGKWARASYHDLDEMKKATLHEWNGGPWTIIGGKQLDPTPHDVTGGWLDAGDPNKYTKNEATAHNMLLLAYEMNKDTLKDGDLYIPESGNGFPDLLDEARFTTDYLLRIQMPDGKVYDRVSLGVRYDIDTNQATTPAAEIAEPCSGATLCAIGSLAYAAAIWQETGLDKDYAKKCLDAAQLSWNYMKEHPSPWPLGTDGGPKKIGSIDYTSQAYDEAQLKVLAAAALFRATGQDEYKAIVEAWMKDTIARAKAVTDNSVVELGYRWDKDEICHLYMTGKGADPKLVADWGTLLAKAAKKCRDDVAKTSPVYEYGAGLPIYHWGSSAGITGRAASMLWWAKNFAPKEEMPSYIQAADEYMQFIMGRNPSRWTLVSSLQDWGATRSPQVMFHTTCINLPPDQADKYLTPDASHTDRLGVMPGYMLGGPVSGPQDFTFDPTKPALDFVHMEPSIIYQCQAVLLSTCLAHMANDYRK